MPDTTRYALSYPAPTDFVKNAPAAIQDLAEDVDGKMAGFSAGPLASRPTSTPGSPGVAGRTYRATDTAQWFLDHGTGWQEIQGPGELKPTARSTAPDGWLLCDGTAVARTTFAALFAAIGTAYGAGDGSTTFNVPNFKGRVPVGRDAAQIEFDALGENGGAKTHALTEAQMPSHEHGPGSLTTNSAGSHAHPAPNGAWEYVYAGGAGTPILNDAAGVQFQFGTGHATPSAGAHTHVLNTGTTSPRGSDEAHNNLQPYQVVNWLVKT